MGFIGTYMFNSHFLSFWDVAEWDQSERRVLFDVDKEGQNIAPKFVPPEDEQEPNESRRYVHSVSPSLTNNGYLIPRIFPRRLWSKLTTAILCKDMEQATEAKTAVEESQRDLRRQREESGQKYVPRFFVLDNGRWKPKFSYVSIYTHPLNISKRGSLHCRFFRLLVYHADLRMGQMQRFKQSRNGSGLHPLVLPALHPEPEPIANLKEVEGRAGGYYYQTFIDIDIFTGLRFSHNIQ